MERKGSRRKKLAPKQSATAKRARSKSKHCRRQYSLSLSLSLSSARAALPSVHSLQSGGERIRQRMWSQRQQPPSNTQLIPPPPSSTQCCQGDRKIQRGTHTGDKEEEEEEKQKNRANCLDSSACAELCPRKAGVFSPPLLSLLRAHCVPSARKEWPSVWLLLLLLTLARRHYRLII